MNYMSKFTGETTIISRRGLEQMHPKIGDRLGHFGLRIGKLHQVSFSIVALYWSAEGTCGRVVAPASLRAHGYRVKGLV